MTESLGAIRDNNLSLFRGRFAEWLACIEYNSLKNKGNVLITIVNPDPTSKADLLHIIRRGNRCEAIPGPDIKCGGSTYVFNQWVKIVTNRFEIPMVDMDGILTTEEGLKILTVNQKNKFEELRQKFPNKKPMKSMWSNNDINRLMMDYLKYVSNGSTPANPKDVRFVASKESQEKIKENLRNQTNKPQSMATWDEFGGKAIKLKNIPGNYLNPITKLKFSNEEKITNSTQKKKLIKGKNISNGKITSKLISFGSDISNYLGYNSTSQEYH